LYSRGKTKWVSLETKVKAVAKIELAKLLQTYYSVQDTTSATRKGNTTVGELAEGFDVSRPAVSQHLAALRSARLVEHEKSGTRNVYRINPEGIATLRRYLDVMWTRALGDLKAVAEATYQRPRKDRS
jgi:DNA-binding transcriptional ArsR family regulator